jgi:Peptidase family M23
MGSFQGMRTPGSVEWAWSGRSSMWRQLFSLLVLGFCFAGTAHGVDQFTPLLASALNPETYPFPGTDGRQHIVYELVLTNASAQPATLQKMEVVDADDLTKVVASYDGPALLSRLRKVSQGPAENAEIEPNTTRLFLLDVDFGQGVAPPARLLHRLSLLGIGPGSPSPSPRSYAVAPIRVVSKAIKIGPPLAGKGWVAINGCCAPGGAHRATGLPVNGRIYFAQRFAIDWVLLDDQGRLVHGDVSDVHNYPDYGVDVFAVADGTVVETLDTLEDQKPPNSPDPKTITLENIGGNHVILDLGQGVFAFFAHMQKGSITVTRGDRVKRGQVLGKLGNTGNTNGPHLHFHLMDGPSMLGSSGLPYEIESFAVAGHISEAKFAAAPGVEGDWGEGLSPAPSPRHDQFPMDLTIVDFPSHAP